MTTPDPPTLRLTQTARDGDQYEVAVELQEQGRRVDGFTGRFRFALSGQEREDLRWYLEDYLQYPADPAPTIAAGIVRRMAELGRELFTALFRGTPRGPLVWGRVGPRLTDLRVEIAAPPAQATAIPWELLRDPETDVPLAARARAFVRTQSDQAQPAAIPAPAAGPLRILLVICRPGRGGDVPFRSVAGRILKSLSDEARAAFQLDVLRPPTFEQMGRVLRAARDAGTPYHAVHFDGHGAYLDVAKMVEQEQQQAAAGDADALRRVREIVPLEPERYELKDLYLDAARVGRHGYLAFENARVAENMRLVGGPELGALLAETSVPVLVLNACQSAYAEPAAAPVAADAGAAAAPDDPRQQVRALGSLAQEIVDAGVAGVVAMRYSVYVVTAAEFVARLYAALGAGAALGEAVQAGRRQLRDDPLRSIAFDARPLQDWVVPLVYEAAPLVLVPPTAGAAPLTISIAAGEAAPARGALDPMLPAPPDAGFFGRDETLLALDRAFDTHAIVLLHAYAGSGKTSTAAEFARWYSLTGGVAGPVLFTSFEQYLTLDGALIGTFGAIFGAWLESAQRIQWSALDAAGRRQVALDVLRAVPVLWIWDNVEPVAGFPAGTPSAWSAAEQRDLAEFLRAARDTRAKFLLTSRRDERGWLGDLPARVAVPPMPFQERLQLAHALAAANGRRLDAVGDWRPLLAFTEGNPLTITVVVGQALREGLHTPEQIAAYVARLRAGEAPFADEEAEGRTRSLGASLGYGFAAAFSEPERAQLALLHFFQGFVDVDALREMGRPTAEWCVPALRGLTRAAGSALLDRAAEVGLLAALGGGYYRIHPALPWYFKRLFDGYYAADPDGPARAFVAALGALGDYYAEQYGAGNSDVITMLRAEEANLLQARQMARAHGWWSAVTSAMQGLRQLYGHTGRRAEWARLVAEIEPAFVDPATDGPRPGREEEWGLVTEYRVQLAREARDWATAERLQRARVEWNRQRAEGALAAPAGTLDAMQRNRIRTLAVSLQGLGEIQRELGQPASVVAYEEALALSERIGEKAGAAACAFNLGHAYVLIPALRDLARAEEWYQRSLALHAPGDRLGRGQCLLQLGTVAYERFQEARAAGEPAAVLAAHLNAAAGRYHEALALLPPDAVNDLAVAHNQLGLVYWNAGAPYLDQALTHYREAIRYKEAAGNVYSAGTTRYNVALALRDAGRLGDALEYARAALRNFTAVGAADEAAKAQRLIARIEQARAGGAGG